MRIHKKTNPKEIVRLKHRKRIRSRIFGTEKCPRLAIFRSNSHIYAQVIDDEKGHTLASASTHEEENRSKVRSNIEGAKVIGNLVAKRAQAKSISNVVFDRGGYVYHGRVKALADGAREGGLKF